MHLAVLMCNVQHPIHYKGGNKMISKLRRSMAGNEGFTLIELMIVVAIIGILSAVAVPNFIAYRDRSRQAAVIATGEAVRSAQAAYASDSADNLYAADLATLKAGLLVSLFRRTLQWMAAAFGVQLPIPLISNRATNALR
jgi:prepilin-type N-terminal cleavage/methylation domain-containing protein